jgi:poly-gamma-glutamate synthesis protein (capsule biosynthesis protein)
LFFSLGLLLLLVAVAGFFWDEHNFMLGLRSATNAAGESPSPQETNESPGAGVGVPVGGGSAPADSASGRLSGPPPEPAGDKSIPASAGKTDSGSSAPGRLPNANPPGPANDERVTLAFVGDVLLGSTVETILRRNGFDYPYHDVKALLSQADLAVANFESPVTERGTEQDKQYVYRTSPKALPAFKEAGFDLVNLANNHVLDYGEIGLLDTLDALDQAGIRRVGAGRDANEAYKPAIVEKKGIKIAFLGVSRVVPEVSWKAGKNHPGVAETYDWTRPVKEIAEAKKAADIVVVLAHWGEERKDRPLDYQVQLARRYIDAGADLVVGSHPHVLQGIEYYKGKWIAYSLGNFIFTTNNVAATLETIILEAACTRQGECELKATPIFTQYARPQIMSADKAKALFSRLSNISYQAKVEPDGAIRRKQ